MSLINRIERGGFVLSCVLLGLAYRLLNRGR
jgi:hypothetical protein